MYFTNHDGTGKYPFIVPCNGYFVGEEESHCLSVVSYSPSKNTAQINCEEMTRDVSVSNDSCDHDNRSENTLT